MDDTQNYLNSILKKRLGSVVNYNGSSKTANTVTRIPKQEEKVENMPTVFRKKHQTVYHGQQQPYNGSYYSQAQSQYISMKQPSNNNKGQYFQQQDQQLIMSEDIGTNNKQQASQRVQYMLISKRIQSLKQDQPIMPTVDVTSYNKIGVNDSRNNSKGGMMMMIKNDIQINQYNEIRQQNDNIYQLKQQKNNQNNNSSEFSSRMSSNTSNMSKRKRIFNNNNVQ